MGVPELKVPLDPPSLPHSLRHWTKGERGAKKKVWSQSWHSKCTLHSRTVRYTKLIRKSITHCQEGKVGFFVWGFFFGDFFLASMWQINRFFFFFWFLTMFPSPSTSTPFSVKDILNLEQTHDVLASSLDDCSRMDCCTVATSSSSSCMLGRMKQEPLRDISSTAASLLVEDTHDSRAGRGNALNFASTFYGKSLMEMEIDKDGKSDAFEGKRRKGELKKELSLVGRPIKPRPGYTCAWFE